MSARVARPELAAELRERVRRDQEVRAGGGATPDRLARWRDVDDGNASRMWELLTEHGWLGHSLVGAGGSADAALLVQHADRDRMLQCLGFELLVEAADAGEAEVVHLAYLTDRLCTHRGLPQRYGTQYARTVSGGYRMLSVEDAEGLDRRRRAVGLGTVAEFERELVGLHGPEVLAAAPSGRGEPS
ncbi:DUF6624 domain-containing protein [Prauserella cavernicola]|uniref:Uncharacterized protein n=1 Tax=Prauserella cavernicola TaxID=2800127 RepID=A0A934QTJ2_9PSEU|nr:DUF6624 domain-containing protein [Prauserella cavernicola]MBK1787987.1 hypothetical protein [Prauserella cavernicola]